MKTIYIAFNEVVKLQCFIIKHYSSEYGDYTSVCDKLICNIGIYVDLVYLFNNDLHAKACT